MDCSLPGSSSMEFPRQEHWEWIAISSSRGPSQPRDQIHVSCVSCTGRCIYHWTTREAHIYPSVYHMILKSSVYLMYLKIVSWLQELYYRLDSPRSRFWDRLLFLVLLLFSHSVVSDSLWPHGLQHTRLPCPLLSPGVCSNSCPLSWWCHPTISSSVTLFSSCPQSFPASGSFPMSPFFASGGQSIGASAAGSVLPMNIQDWFPLGLTGLLFLQSKRLSRVFSNTTVQKHQFLGPQTS